MLLRALLTSARGFAMGAADIVPGVSGGTIALVLGIYERLVASVRAGSSTLGHVLRGDFAGARRWFFTVEWRFIVPLVVGIGVAIIALAGLIETQLHDRPETMAAIFTGLVAGSVVIAWNLLREPRRAHVAIASGVAVGVFVLLGLVSGTSEDSVSQVVDPGTLAFFLAGSIAICAMILPGISGSFLLVIMGMYGPVLAAVSDREVGLLATFIVGAVVGLALFSQVLHWSLQRHHDRVLAALIGLMAGSIRVLWPWPNGVDSTEIAWPTGPWISAVVAGAVAFVLVIVIGRAAQRLEQSSATVPASSEPT